MKILLLNPQFLKKFSRPQRSPAVTKSGSLYFPLWLAYATGVLGKNGFDVDLVDAPADDYSLDDVIEKTRKFQPSLIVLDTSTPSIYNDVAVAGQLKDICPSYTFCVYPQILMGRGFPAEKDRECSSEDGNTSEKTFRRQRPYSLKRTPCKEKGQTGGNGIFYSKYRKSTYPYRKYSFGSLVGRKHGYVLASDKTGSRNGKDHYRFFHCYKSGTMIYVWNSK